MGEKKGSKHNIAELGKNTRFTKGHKRGGYPKGLENIKTKVAKQIMLEVLATNHETGKYMTYNQFRKDMKQLCYKHSMVAKHFLEGYFGKAVERVQQDIQQITITTDKTIPGVDNTITVDTSNDTNTDKLVDKTNDNSNAQSTQDDE